IRHDDRSFVCHCPAADLCGSRLDFGARLLELREYSRLDTAVSHLADGRRIPDADRFVGGASREAALMIVGIGSDLCNVERIEKSLDRWGDRFLGRVFTEVEQAK